MHCCIALLDTSCMFLDVIGLIYKAAPRLPASNTRPAQARVLPCEDASALDDTCKPHKTLVDTSFIQQRTCYQHAPQQVQCKQLCLLHWLAAEWARRAGASCLEETAELAG